MDTRRPRLNSHSLWGAEKGRQEESSAPGLAHLGGHHRAEFGKQHVSRERKDNDVSEVGKPHHPLEVSHILDNQSRGKGGTLRAVERVGQTAERAGQTAEVTGVYAHPEGGAQEQKEGMDGAGGPKEGLASQT